MTISPIDSDQVRGVKGPKYTVSPRCANPTCTNSPRGGRALTEHAHHMWRRSKTAKRGGEDWIEIPTGQVVANKVGLCPRCHDDITGRLSGHKAAIRLAFPPLVFEWWTSPKGKAVNFFSEKTWDYIRPIDPQPPTREALVASPADIESENACPTCGQPRARRRPASSGSRRRRARKTWLVKVPDHVQEKGADVLDGFTEDLAPLLGVEPDTNGTYTSGRYWVLVPALAYAQMQRDDFINSIRGRG